MTYEERWRVKMLFEMMYKLKIKQFVIIPYARINWPRLTHYTNRINRYKDMYDRDKTMDKARYRMYTTKTKHLFR